MQEDSTGSSAWVRKVQVKYLRDFFQWLRKNRRKNDTHPSPIFSTLNSPHSADVILSQVLDSVDLVSHGHADSESDTIVV